MMPVTIEPESRFREGLRLAFRLAAGEGDELPEGDVQALQDELVRGIDDLGPARAETLRAAEAMLYWAETGRCWCCGDAGTLHVHESTRGGVR